MTTRTSSRIRLMAGTTLALLALGACGTSTTSAPGPGGSSGAPSGGG